MFSIFRGIQRPQLLTLGPLPSREAPSGGFSPSLGYRLLIPPWTLCGLLSSKSIAQKSSVSSMSSHKHAWVKVNVPVDVGVSGIVSALSDFPGLETAESCKGYKGRGPWVCFRFGNYWSHPWRDLTSFVCGFLAPRIFALVGDDARKRIDATTAGHFFGEISVRARAASRMEAALRRLAREFSADRPRKSGCSCGIPCTVQEHC